MPSSSCGTCRFFHRTAEVQGHVSGQCRRKPPQLMSDWAHSSAPWTLWPTLEATEWCGEWKPTISLLAPETIVDFCAWCTARLPEGLGTLPDPICPRCSASVKARRQRIQGVFTPEDAARLGESPQVGVRRWRPWSEVPEYLSTIAPCPPELGQSRTKMILLDADEGGPGYGLFCFNNAGQVDYFLIIPLPPEDPPPRAPCDDAEFGMKP